MEVDILSVRSVLQMTPVIWQQFADRLPDELLRRAPAPKEWSAQECLVHLLDTEKIFTSRVLAFQTGKDFAAFNPENEGALDIETSFLVLVKRFTALRQESLVLFDTILPDSLEVQVRHAELGPVRLGEMLNEWAAHDFNHTMQAMRALAQPFMANSGAWQIYFKEHIF